MTGELIPTAYTYDQGRVALNESFSGTANFNNISGSTLSADTIYSGLTNLYDIFLTEAEFISGIEWTSGTGTHSIIANNDTTMIAGDYTVVAGYANSGESSYSFIGGGSANWIYPLNHYSAIIAGSGNTIQNAPFPTGNAFGIIIGGYDNIIEKNAENSSIISSDGCIIESGASYSTIIGSRAAAVQASSTQCVIIGGGSQNISGSTLSTILGGGGNSAIYDSSHAVVFGRASISDSDDSFAFDQSEITGGSKNIAIQLTDIFDSTYSFGFGNSSLISSADYSFAGGRYAGAYKDFSFVFGRGYNNTTARLIASGTSSINISAVLATGHVGAVGDYSTILGGYNHDIYDGAGQSAILGGRDNQMFSTAINSIILGGSDMIATESDTVYGIHFSGTSMSAVTFYSGSTDLSDLFGSTVDKTFNDAGYTGAGTATWDYSNGFNSQITLTADTTLTITNAAEGDYGTLIVTQDITGGWDLILGGGDTHKVVTGGGGVLTLTSAASAEDIISFVKRGASTFYWNVGYNYS